MTRNTFILLVAALLLVAGCARPTSNYLADRPLIIYPSEQKKLTPQLQKQATDAFLKALSRYRWDIRNFDRDNHIIVAEACRGVEHCVEIVATIKADAAVSIVRSPGQRINLNEENMLRKWMNNLERQYRKNMKWAW